MQDSAVVGKQSDVIVSVVIVVSARAKGIKVMRAKGDLIVVKAI